MKYQHIGGSTIKAAFVANNDIEEKQNEGVNLPDVLSKLSKIINNQSAPKDELVRVKERQSLNRPNHATMRKMADDGDFAKIILSTSKSTSYAA